ncbi:MAG TPA: hypothetical protein VN436_14445, partial [Holophaga sp.]|nr:hypothetical protein [Holophaga sp.]
MSLGRIYEWAHLAPERKAVVWNGRTLTYGDFARGLEAARQALLRLELREGSVAVIIVAPLLDAWTYALALRSLGIHTVAVASAEAARALGLRDVSCVIVDGAACREKAPDLGAWPGAKLLEYGESFHGEGLT